MVLSPGDKPVDRYAVMGHPVAHSKSPLIHAAFARQTSQKLVYTAIEVPLDGFSRAVADFAAAGGKGLNITLPFKQEAWALAKQRAERAERAGAVNTLIIAPQGLRGDNTDGVGLVRDLTANHGIELARRRILVLGAGGAVRGVLEPLLEQHPSVLVIANRTQARAQALAELFGDLGPVRARGFAELKGQHFDLVINGTAASLAGEVPPIPAEVVQDAACYDMMYGREPTAFLRWAAQHGAGQCMDGLGMLVEQAAESFYLWRGVRPRTQPVIETLRAQG